MATHDVGQAEIARHEVDRIRMKTELLEHRDQNLEIRSPIDGIVVTGDLEDAEGMPLEVGQSLFEIAPLDELLIEVDIPEDVFPYVRSGMPVDIRLDAYPLKPIRAVLQRVHMRAELREENNVFVGEVRIDNPRGSLRPGMRGLARIESEKQALGWIFFRRPVSALLLWLGW
jgi:multidrug efflux pump subunit AcrA (membrane-fusion protein)